MRLGLFWSRNFAILIGVLLILTSQIILTGIFYPVVGQEVGYLFQTQNVKDQKVSSKDAEIRIIIPKINVNEKVFPNIDPFDKNAYQEVLKKGVAESSGSASPGQEGNIFIFAHSTDSPLNVSKYNAVFYLIYKLTPGDEILLSYEGKSYRYSVDTTKIIDSNEVNFLHSSSQEQTLTLMTCWPPGTTLKRMLVESHLVQ